MSGGDRDRDPGDEDDALVPGPDCANCTDGRVDLEHLGWFWCSCPAGLYGAALDARRRRSGRGRR
jgi:hypothetical protein